MDSLMAEMSVIGCMLMAPEKSEQVYTRLTPRMFGEQPLGQIFACCCQLHQEGVTPDAVTVDGRIGSEYRTLIAQCAEIAPSIGRLDSYIDLMIEGWRVRSMISAATDIQLGGGTSDELLERFRQVVREQEMLLSAQQERNTKSFLQSAISFYRSLDEEDTSIKTGWRDFDALTGGLQRKAVYVISARPGKGKTDFALQLAQKVALTHTVNYNTMEMPVEQLMMRVASRATRINSARIRDRRLDETELSRVWRVLDLMAQHMHINFDETPRIDAGAIEEKIIKYHPDLLVIDHLGLMGAKTEKKNQWEEVAQTTHALKTLAMQHDLCIIELVQMSRAADLRKATLGDLYGGAAVEQDADAVLALDVPEMEGFLSGDDSVPITVSVKKNRHGGVGDLHFMWQPQYHSYSEIERRYQDEDRFAGDAPEHEQVSWPKK